MFYMHKDDISLSAVQRGAIRHKTLPNSLIERVCCLEQVFAEVYPRPHTEWLDSFKRDAHPESEVRIWEAMAAAYSCFTQRHTLSLHAKREVLSILLMRSAADEQSTLASAKLRHLNRAKAQELVSLYSTAATAKPS